jgi:hypothetical protein
MVKGAEQGGKGKPELGFPEYRGYPLKRAELVTPRES